MKLEWEAETKSQRPCLVYHFKEFDLCLLLITWHLKIVRMRVIFIQGFSGYYWVPTMCQVVLGPDVTVVEMARLMADMN